MTDLMRAAPSFLEINEASSDGERPQFESYPGNPHLQDDRPAVTAKTVIKSAAGAAALALLSACATMPDETVTDFAAPLVGTEVDWMFTYANGARESFTSRVVAAGDDFAIYLANTETAGNEPYHYYAEFAGGLFYTPCDQSLPTLAGRTAALNLWPLSAGERAQVGGEVLVGERDSVTVGGQGIDVVWSEFSYTQDDKLSTDRFAVAADFGTVVEVHSDNGYVGVVRAIRPAEGADGGALIREVELLGECASLLLP